MAGAAGLTFLIVAYTKRTVDKFWPVMLGTDLYVVLVSSAILVAATAARGTALTWDSVLLALFNGFLVAATAGKLNDKAIDERDRKVNGN